MEKFQIRDDSFGLALYDAGSALEALLDFVADKTKGNLRPQVEVLDDGTAELVYDGVRYRAVPANLPEPDPAAAKVAKEILEKPHIAAEVDE